MDKFDWGIRACGVLLLWAATAVALTAQTYTVLHSFHYAEGVEPLAGLVQATNGNLYGTTGLGGAYPDAGTIFKITPSGTLTAIYDFCSQSHCTDGAMPAAMLVQGTDGSFYGTTMAGGVYPDAGTIFKITPSGTLTTLYTFFYTYGYEPRAGLVQGADGSFYGTTGYGVLNTYTSDGGTVFKITPDGKLTTLFTFCPDGYPSCADGDGPMAGWCRAPMGNSTGQPFVAGPIA
jgi:uncharacterized repeat protein (TIGR03803 family)